MSQTKYPGKVFFSWFNVAECQSSLQLDKCKFACVDVGTKKPYECWKLKEHLSKKWKSKAQLQEESRTFIKNLLYNLDYYFNEADHDRLMVMNLHPMMHWHSFA